MVLAIAGPRRVGHPSSHERGGDELPRRRVRNVARPERIGSVAVGVGLVGYGLRRRDPLGLISAIVGAFLLRRGATGHCSVYHALGVSTGPADALLDTRERSDVTSRAATVNARKAVKVEHSVTIDKPRS